MFVEAQLNMIKLLCLIVNAIFDDDFKRLCKTIIALFQLNTSYFN